MNIGNKIKKIRYKYNMSQEELAKILDINRNYLSRIETNKSFPTSDILVKLSLSFNISIDTLLDISSCDKYENKKEKIYKINKYCEELNNDDLDFIIRLLNNMSNN